MAGSNLTDPKNNDLARSCPPYDFGPADGKSENNPTRPLPGSGGLDNDHATPEARRAGYGHQYLGPNSEGMNAPGEGGKGSNKIPRGAMGGHNVDARNQYTVKVPRGSSL
jgi:hypothetical protein